MSLMMNEHDVHLVVGTLLSHGKTGVITFLIFAGPTNSMSERLARGQLSPPCLPEGQVSSEVVTETSRASHHISTKRNAGCLCVVAPQYPTGDLVNLDKEQHYRCDLG